MRFLSLAHGVCVPGPRHSVCSSAGFWSSAPASEGAPSEELSSTSMDASSCDLPSLGTEPPSHSTSPPHSAREYNQRRATQRGRAFRLKEPIRLFGGGHGVFHERYLRFSNNIFGAVELSIPGFVLMRYRFYSSRSFTGTCTVGAPRK